MIFGMFSSSGTIWLNMQLGYNFVRYASKSGTYIYLENKAEITVLYELIQRLMMFPKKFFDDSY